jgi:hypothetical protein
MTREQLAIRIQRLADKPKDQYPLVAGILATAAVATKASLERPLATIAKAFVEETLSALEFKDNRGNN